jgi:hypothetical protein
VAGAVGLTVVNGVQLGLDPATDAAEGLDIGALAADGGETAEDGIEDAADATCGGESFTSSTKVLLASGVAVAISSLRVGDKILATDTKTGKTQPEAVAAVLIHHDTDLYDLKIQDHGKTSVIDTTSNHLYWVPGTSRHPGRWVKAGNLKPGTRLRNPSGSTVTTVVSGRVPSQQDSWMWDLTVPGNNDHDFYIAAGFSTVLVHNISGPCRGNTNRRLRRNNGQKYPSQEDALQAAREDAGSGGRARFRGFCSKNEYHVDFFNKDGQLIMTSHYSFPEC